MTIRPKPSPPKFSVELFMWPNPNPHPKVAVVSQSYGPVVEGHAHRPCSRVIAQSLETQAWVLWVRKELSISRAGGHSDAWRKGIIQLPEFRGSGRLHSCLSNSSSVNSVNWSGFSRKRASISSRYFVSFGRGVGSLMIRLHSASPSSSGTNWGSNSASCARSSAERPRIAFSISSTVLTARFYNKGRSLTTPLPVH